MVIDPGALDDDELEAQLLTWEGRVAAGMAVALALLGEVDTRGTWAAQGAVSCAHWASWRLGLTLATARERVRVARALRGLSLLGEAFAQGRLSYAQARAVTRVATAGDEHTWVELARHCTAAQLEKAVRGAVQVRRNEEVTGSVPAPSSRVRWDADGTLVLTVRVAPEHAPAVLAVLEQRQAEEQAERDARLQELAVELATGDVSAETSVPVLPEPYVYVEPDYPQLAPLCGLFDQRTPEELALLEEWHEELARRRALRDAWCAQQEQLQAEAAARELPTARATLADGLVRALTRPAEGKPVSVRLLVDPVSGWARTSGDELLPPSTLKAVLRSLPGRTRLPRVRPLEPGDLARFDQGRRSRLVSPALRELLGQLDGERCRFPGCTHTRHLHAHHVVFWRDGGGTDLSNLVLVCSKHHALIHDEGSRLVLDPDRTLQVHTAEGTPLLHHPALPWQPAEDLDPTGVITADTLPTQWTGEQMNLGYVVNVMLLHAA